MKRALLHYSSLDKTTISQGFIVQYCCGIQGDHGDRVAMKLIQCSVLSKFNN